MISYLINLLPPLMQLGIMYFVVIAVCSFLFGFFYPWGRSTFYLVQSKIWMWRHPDKEDWILEDEN